MARTRTKYVGVYQREDTQRRFEGRPDLIFDITYKRNGAKVWEKVGRRSEGYTAAMAASVRGERLRALRHPELTIQTAQVAPSLGQVWQHYRLVQEQQGKRLAQDDSRWRRHLAPLDGLPLDQLTPGRLDSLDAELRTANLAAQSRKHVLALIRRIVRRSIRDGLWSGPSPFERYTLPAVNNERWRWLTPEEAQALLEELGWRSAQWRLIALVSLHAGLRASEIFRLRWADIDLATRTLRVRTSKNGRGRVVHLTETLYGELSTLVRGTPDGLVFVSRTGKPIEEVSSTFERAVAALGLNEGVTDPLGKVVFHTLRHTCASWQVQAGVPLYVVGQALGHSSETMTRRYAHLAPEQGQQAARALDAMLNAHHSSSSDALR